MQGVEIHIESCPTEGLQALDAAFHTSLLKDQRIRSDSMEDTQRQMPANMRVHEHEHVRVIPFRVW